MAMYLGNQAVKILAPSINLFDKSLIQLDQYDFANCSESELSADKNTLIARGNSDDTTSEFAYDRGWVRGGYYNSSINSKGIKLKKGDIVTVSADFTLIEQGNRSAVVRCYLYANHPAVYLRDTVNISITETTQRLTWTFTVTGDAVDFYPVFPINSNKVKIENISVNKVKDYWRVRSGVYMGRNPKNLIPLPYEEVVVQNGSIHNGVTYTIANDGVVTLNGTSTAAHWHRLNMNIPMAEGKTYTISGAYGSKGSSYWRVYVDCYNADGTKSSSFASMDGAVTFTAPTGTVLGKVYIYVGAGHTYNNQVFKPMLNEGTKALPYFYYD